MGIIILIKIQTEPQNEKETANPNQPNTLDTHPLTENNLDTQTSNPDPTQTTNHPHEKNTPKCAHYFGYILSGNKIPEDCLTCSKLLKCLTSKGGIQEEE